MEGVEPEGAGEAEGVEPVAGGGREANRQRNWHMELKSVMADKVKVRSWSTPSRFWSTRTSTSLSHSYKKGKVKKKCSTL